VSVISLLIVGLMVSTKIVILLHH